MPLVLVGLVGIPFGRGLGWLAAGHARILVQRGFRIGVSAAVQPRTKTMVLSGWGDMGLGLELDASCTTIIQFKASDGQF